jgi:hypothetical protein
MPTKQRPAFGDKRHRFLHWYNAIFLKPAAAVKQMLGAGYCQSNAAIGAERAGEPAAYAKVLYSPSSP